MPRINSDLLLPPILAALSCPQHTGGALLHCFYFLSFFWLWTCEIVQLLSLWHPSHYLDSHGFPVVAATRLTGPRGCSPAGRSLSLLQERSGVNSPCQRARAGPRPPARLHHQQQDRAELPGLQLSVQGGPHPGKGGRVPRCRSPQRSGCQGWVSWTTFFSFP